MYDVSNINCQVIPNIPNLQKKQIPSLRPMIWKNGNQDNSLEYPPSEN